MINQSYIIIGAGITGITIANNIKKRKVLIIEANNYIGGRIKTIKINNKAVNLGARWINENYKSNNLFKNINKKITNFTNIPIYTNKGKIKYNWENIKNVLDILHKNKNKYKGWTLKEALCQQGWKTKNILDHIALWALVDFEWGLNYEQTGIYAAEKNSKQYYMQNAEELVKLKNNKAVLKLEEKVLQIKENNNSVLVTTNKKTYVANKVILTSSINVLKNKNINIIPELDKEKVNILNKYDFMAKYEVVIAIFNKEFWKDIFRNHHCILYGDEDENIVTMIINTKIYTNVNALEFHFTGENTEITQNISVCKQFINKIIKTICNKHCYKIIDLIVTNWSTNENTLGAFTTLPFNIKKEEMDELRKPHLNNKLFFAGEGLYTKHTGYIQSAYKSAMLGIKLTNNYNDQSYYC